MPDYDVHKLCEAIRASNTVLGVVRRNRLAIERECAGHLYTEGGSERPIKVNLLSQYKETFENLLVANEPRYLLDTLDIEAAAAVRVEQDWLNEQACRMELGTTGRMVVGNALTAYSGICKVALASPCEAATLAWGISAGEPIATAIDIDDFVYGTAARTFASTEFMGHRYRCPLDVAKKMYGRRAKDLVAEEPSQFDKQTGEEKIDQLFHGTYQPEEFEEHVDLWEIYLPRHQVVVTLSDSDIHQAGENQRAKALWEQKWVGPPWGPYIFLSFNRVAGAALGKAPMQDLYELHCDYNNAHRKVAFTLKNLKENIVYPRNQSKDAEELQKANHLSYAPVENPEMIKAVSMGGATIQPLMVTAQGFRQLFDTMGGNLSLLRGAAAQSKTATQDKILNQNAGGTVNAMQGKVETFMSKLGESMLWFAHHHPELVMESRYEAPGSRGRTRRLYPPGSARTPARNHPFHRSRLTIDPFSIRHRGPEEMLGTINQIVGQLMPMLPMLQQSGQMLDANLLVQIQSELANLPIIKRLFVTREPPSAEGDKGLSHGKTLPNQTERTYNRNDVSNGQPPGADQQMAELPAFSPNGAQ